MVIIIALLSVALLAFIGWYTFKTKRKVDDVFQSWMGSAIQTSGAYKPIIKMFKSETPINIKEYKRLVTKKIKKNMYVSINSQIYTDITVNKKAVADVFMDINRECFLPSGYASGFNDLYKIILVEVIKDYEKSGYKVDITIKGSQIQLKMFSNL